MRPGRRFAFQLALALGYVDVDGMLNSIPSYLFDEWMEFYRMEPFGPVRGDIQSAIIARTIAEVNRNSEKRSNPFTVDEFMPQFERKEPKKMDTHTLKQQLLAWAKFHNRRVTL